MKYNNQKYNICIEASPAVHKQAGLGTYTAGLIQGLIHTDPGGQYSIAYNDSDNVNLEHPYDKLLAFTSAMGNKPWRMRNALTYFGARPFDRAFPDVQLYHSTGHLLPKFKNIKTVFTLHDLIPLIYPEYHLPLNKIFLSQMFPRFLRQADAIISVSESTKRDAINLLDIPEEKITVVSEGVEPKFFPIRDPNRLASIRDKHGLPEQFILIVSTIEPRKNHTVLLDAYAELRKTHPDVGLVIVGKNGWMYEGFYDHLRETGLQKDVHLLGRVDEFDLTFLLSACTIFAFPSLYEGFGLPPLEAMSCGAPVVVSNTSSLPEVVGNAGITLDPKDVRAWVNAFSALLDDPQKRLQMSLAGQKQASKFKWEETAKQTQAVYQQVLGLA